MVEKIKNKPSIIVNHKLKDDSCFFPVYIEYITWDEFVEECERQYAQAMAELFADEQVTQNLNNPNV